MLRKVLKRYGLGLDLPGKVLKRKDLGITLRIKEKGPELKLRSGPLHWFNLLYRV